MALWAVLRPTLLEAPAPDILGGRQHGGDQRRLAVIARRALGRRLLHLGRIGAGEHANGGQRVDTKHAPTDQGQDYRANADGAPAAKAAAATAAAAVFHVVRFAIAFPFH